MATTTVAERIGRQRSEEGDAVYGVVMAVSAASGGMIAMFAAVNGNLPFTAAPTIVLLVALARRAVPVAAWAGLATWALIIPMADGIAILAPAAMGLLSLAFAVGPDRLLEWVDRDWIGREEEAGTLPMAWIEDDRRTR
jgi:hypothetical protein